MKRIKICLLGDNNVGKTSIIKRFVNGDYSDEKIISTLSSSYKTIIIDHQEYRLEIVDVVFDVEKTDDTFFNAHACVVVYDPENKESIQNICNYFFVSNRLVSQDELYVKCICQNKSDISSLLSTNEINDISLSCKADLLFEVSAKENLGIEYMFTSIIYKVIEKFSINESNQNHSPKKIRKVCSLQ